MEDISSYIETMRTAIYGRDMREAICQSFIQLNSLPDEMDTKITNEVTTATDSFSSLPKEICTFMLSSIFGGLKATQSIPMLSPTRGTAINDYSPKNGDKLLVWKSNSLPCIENEDYTLTEEEGVYKIKAIGNHISIATVQIWNMQRNLIAPAYTNISSLTTDSISGDVTQGE